MRPVNNTTTTTTTAAGFGAGGGFWHWNSPLIYLFGGLGILLGFITVALLILACSYRKSLCGYSSENQEKQGDKQVEIIEVVSEPNVVVIMPGEKKPTYLANPVSCKMELPQ